MQKPEFPCLPNTIARLKKLASDPKLSAKQVGRSVATDPALAAAVVYHAIHVQHRHLGNPISTLRQAAMMLGIKTVTELAEGLPQAAERLGAGRLPHYMNLMGRAALGGILALTVAYERRDLEPGEVALAGLLSPLGELALWAVSPAEMETLSSLLGEPGVQAQEAEYVVFGTGIEDAGRTLAEAWDLPELLCRSLEPTNALQPRALGVMLASKIAWHAVSHWQKPGLTSDLRLMAGYLGMNQSGLAVLVDDALLEFNNRCQDYGLAPIPMLRHVPFQEPKAQEPAFCLAPQPDVYGRVEQRLASLDREQHDAIIESFIFALHRGLGLNRVIYARLERDPFPMLIAEAVIGTDYEPEFNRFKLSLEGGHLFSRLMAKPMAFRLKGRNQKAAWDLVPTEIHNLIGTDQFLACSIFVHGRAVGLVYADRRYPSCEIDESTFDRFKQICRMAVKALSRAPEAETPAEAEAEAEAKENTGSDGAA